MRTTLTFACNAAIVHAQADPITPAIPSVAHLLPLSVVRPTGGPLRKAQNLNTKHLLALEPDLMLACYRLRVGLEPKAKSYGDWPRL